MTGRPESSGSTQPSLEPRHPSGAHASSFRCHPPTPQDTRRNLTTRGWPVPQRSPCLLPPTRHRPLSLRLASSSRSSQFVAPSPSGEPRASRLPSPPPPTTNSESVFVPFAPDAKLRTGVERSQAPPAARVSSSHPLAILHKTSPRQPTIPDAIKRLMQACRKDTIG